LALLLLRNILYLTSSPPSKPTKKTPNRKRSFLSHLQCDRPTNASKVMMQYLERE